VVEGYSTDVVDDNLLQMVDAFFGKSSGSDNIIDSEDLKIDTKTMNLTQSQTALMSNMPTFRI
jgi:hypothetical protein